MALEYVPIDVRHFQAVDVPPFVIFHEIAEIGSVGLYGGGAVTFLFQQIQVAFRQHIFPLGFRMPDIYPAVINVGVRGISVVKVRQMESGGRYVGAAVADRHHICILRQQ